MIILKKVRWSDIFSYGKNNEIDFTRDKVVQLVGANGNGKSSIAWIIEEALYNKNSKNRKKESLVNWNSGAKSYSIEFEFSVDDDEYLIKVKRSSSISASLLKNGIDISSHTSTNTFKQVEEILGYNFKTFSQILFQTHSSSLEFLNSPDTARKKFLIELINLTKYTDIGEIFKKLQSELTKELSYIEGKVSTIQEWIDKNQSIDRSKKELLELPEIDNTLSTERDNIKVQLSNADNTNKRVEKNRVYTQAISNIKLDETVQKPEEDINPYVVKKAELNKTVKDANTAKAGIQKLKDSCPTCLQKISPEFKESLIQVEELKISEALNSLVEIDKSITQLQAILKDWEANVSAQNELERLHCLIDQTVPDLLIDKSQLELRLGTLDSHIKNSIAAIEEIKKHNKDAEIHNNKIDLINEQLNAYESELKQWQDKNNSLVQKLANISVLTKAFSTTGLVAYKLETITNTLQEVVNRYLVTLSNGQFQLIFNLSGNDKLDITISNNGINADISSLSAGETTRVNVAVLLGIRKLMSQISGNSINLLFLDESISTLDAEGKERLVEILLEEKNINTLIVSHEYQHPLIPNILVQKENGISYLTRE